MDIENCDYHDTVNITGNEKLANGSYLYEGVSIPPHLTGIYNYEILFDGIREEVPEHRRGCVCKIKRCFKFCCHPRKLKEDYNFECSSELSDELKYDPLINITQADGSRKLEHVFDDFVFQEGLPCYSTYTLRPEEDERDKWELFANGTLLLMSSMQYLSSRDYCFTPSEINGTFKLNPTSCDTIEEPSHVTTWIMVASIPFIILTILVYGFVPKLRNLHGKCLIGYLFSLAFGYTLLAIINMNYFEPRECIYLAPLTYYFFVAAFFWLSVISFDLWHSFRNTSNGNVQRFMQMKRFYVYSAYAWGCPIILTIAIILAEQSDLDDDLKSGIGGKACWIKTHDWSAMIYFYGPNGVLLLFNMLMFISTSLTIYKIKRNVKQLNDRKEKTRQDSFGLFLRLFIVMGLNWIFETASYLNGTQNSFSKIFSLSDYFNAAQGIIIFILFVCKRKVLMLIKKRVHYGESSISQGHSRYKGPLNQQTHNYGREAFQSESQQRTE